MNVLLLNALPDRNQKEKIIKDRLIEEMRKHKLEYEIVDLFNSQIKICLGCGSCDWSSPGICIIKDKMQEILPMWIKAHLVILLTPLSFGGYHSELKKVIDRLMPLKVCQYMLYKREMHHKNRYNVTPGLLSIGILSEPDNDQEMIFHNLVKRNAYNFCSDRFNSFILYENESKQKMKEKIISGLKLMGGVA